MRCVGSAGAAACCACNSRLTGGTAYDSREPVARMAGHGISMEWLGSEDGVEDGGWHVWIGSVADVDCTIVVFDRGNCMD